MIKCIVGKKGFGKTKLLIDHVNKAVGEESGSVICIERGAKLTYDINHKCRLIDISPYHISCYSGYYGFICGLYAQNYDISSVFIDSLYKVVGSEDPAAIDDFMANLERFSADNNVKFLITISDDLANVPASVRKYV